MYPFPGGYIQYESPNSTVTLIFPNAPESLEHIKKSRFSLVVVSVWDRFFLGGRGEKNPTQKIHMSAISVFV